jgi:hypothetical protein
MIAEHPKVCYNYLHRGAEEFNTSFTCKGCANRNPIKVYPSDYEGDKYIIDGDPMKINCNSPNCMFKMIDCMAI